MRWEASHQLVFRTCNMHSVSEGESCECCDDDDGQSLYRSASLLLTYLLSCKNHFVAEFC